MNKLLQKILALASATFILFMAVPFAGLEAKAAETLKTVISFEDGEAFQNFADVNCTHKETETQGVTDGTKAMQVDYVGNGWPSFNLNAGTAWDFSKGYMTLDVTNPMSENVQLTAQFYDGANAVHYYWDIPAGQTINVSTEGAQFWKAGAEPNMAAISMIGLWINEIKADTTLIFDNITFAGVAAEAVGGASEEQSNGGEEMEESALTKLDMPKISFEQGETIVPVDREGKDDKNVSIIEIISDKGVTDGKNAVKVTFPGGMDWPGMHLMPEEGSAWNLGEGHCLSFNVTNIMEDKPAPVYIKMYTKTDATIMSVNVPAGETMTVYAPMSSDSPATKLGMLANPPVEGGFPAAIGWTDGNGADVTEITHITFWMLYPEQDYTVIIDDIKSVVDPSTNMEEIYGNLLDKYGQYNGIEHDSKITQDSDFAARLEEENKWLDEMQAITDAREISDYYGMKDERFKQEAKGYFYTTKIDGKWMLVDPQGYPYISTGIDIIRLDDARTWVSEREFMFQELPDPNGELGDHYSPVANTAKSPFDQISGTSFNFYTANLERKYGNDWKIAWQDNAIRRFKAWGFSSMGCWIDPDMFYGKGEAFKLPYVAHAWLNSGHAMITSDNGNTLSDPFDPAFAETANAQMKALADRGVHTDPWCMGVYVDNEIQWGNGEQADQHYDVVEGVFKGDATAEDAYAKKAFIAALVEKYTDIAALNEAWGTSLESWDALKAPYSNAIPTEDASMCLSLIADQYYRIVSEAVNANLGNLLYLGSRLAHWGTSEEIVDACAKYADVVSFNCYRTDVNQGFMMLERFDKPVIIGEFHFNAVDHNHFAPGLVQVGTQEGRGEAYEEYMLSVYKNDKMVGAHWFQYYDQPTLGRAWDGENSNCGFVDLTDQPYMPLVEAAKRINESAYSVRLLGEEYIKEGTEEMTAGEKPVVADKMTNHVWKYLAGGAILIAAAAAYIAFKKKSKK